MNRLKAKIVNERYADGLGRIEAEAGGYLFRLLIFADTGSKREGKDAYLLIKESEIALSKTKPVDISISNRIECRISDIKKGLILCEIKLLFSQIELVSIITTESVERLAFSVGETVYALIKANEIYLEEI